VPSKLQIARQGDAHAKGEQEATRKAAADSLLDRGYGKATQMIAGDKDADAIQVETSMTDVAKLLLAKFGE